jgi:hypothetical protein
MGHRKESSNVVDGSPSRSYYAEAEVLGHLPLEISARGASSHCYEHLESRSQFSRELLQQYWNGGGNRTEDGGISEI